MVWLKRLGWCVGAVLLLLIVLWLSVPALLRWQLPLRAGEALGRPVTLGEVVFHPWNLDLTLHDLAVGGAAGSADPLLQVAQVHTRVSPASIWRLAPVIGALEVDGLRLRVARTAEGHYDVDDLLARFAPKPDAKPDGESTHFALYNFQLRDAQVRFDDRPVKQVQLLDALQLSLPFISNLPAQVEVQVEPRLAFKLNGAAFDSGAQATPFAQTRNGDLKVSFADLDLKPYLGYLPATLPVRIAQGRVAADLAVTFAVPAGGTPQVSIKGNAAVRDLGVTDTAGAPLLAWRRLQLGLRDVQPLARTLAFGKLQIDGLELRATRDGTGHINLSTLASPASRAPAAVAASAPSAAAGRNAATPWKVELDDLALAEARVLWTDAAVKPAAALQLDGLVVEAKQVQWPLTQAIAVRVKGALHAQKDGGPALAEFEASGPVTEHDAKLDLKLTGVSLAGFAPYLAQTLAPSVDGQLAARATLDWSGAADAPRLRLALANLTLDNLKVREPQARAGQDAIALKQLALADAQVDVLARTVALGSVKLAQPAVQLARDAKGRLNVEGWVGGGDTPSAPASAPEARAPATPAWKVQLKDFQIDAGQVRLADAGVRGGATDPVRVELANLKVALQGFEWQGDRAVAPANLEVSARIGGITRDRQKPHGTLDYKGRMGLQPLLAQGTLRVERFPVQLFAPYFADPVQLALLRAEAGYTGSVAVRQSAAGLDVDAAGDVLLGDVHVATLAGPGRGATGNDELLSWQALSLKGVKVAVKPKVRPRIDIGEMALSDFYARLLVTEQGRLNLQDVTGAPVQTGATGVPPAPTTQTAAASAPPPPASAGNAPPVDATSLPADIRIGATRLVNGRVDYTDHFITPNYSAALTELNGQLGAFSSDSPNLAALELHGRAAGTALLEITGQVNPFAKPLAMDIRAKATDLELAPLSPYAGKYVGYAIDRGKLSMEVAYKIDPDGKLNASNKVVLNQLTFGQKIESKDALKLPVLLAVALLKDRNGVIDVNLPISGSINDPKFSVGGIIVRVIVNLITKAITSPFSLLTGGGGGGGEDLSLVEFKPGTAQVAPGAGAALDKVAKALTDRPALKMTVTGAADLHVEGEAYQSAMLEQRLVDEQRRQALRAGAAPAAPASGAGSAPVALGVEDKARLLKQVYEDTDLPDKPRNAIGFAKDIPGLEMEALLKARIPVTDDAMRALAQQRGLAVRDALIAKGLPSERLFLAAPRLVPPDEQGWTPRVQLSLETN